MGSKSLNRQAAEDYSGYNDYSRRTESQDDKTKPFKQKKLMYDRVMESKKIRDKYPNKIPIILERYTKEKTLPFLDKYKFLVPGELTVSQFLILIRNRMKLNKSQAIYLIINAKSISSMSCTLAEIYTNDKDPDGFLYFTYASQEVFGNCDYRDSTWGT